MDMSMDTYESIGKRAIVEMRVYHDIRTLRAGRTVARSGGVRAVDA